MELHWKIWRNKILSSNKNIDFYLNLKFDDSSEDLSDTFKNAQELVELLLRTLSKVKHEFYTFQSLNTPFIFYFFKTEDRKRLPQVRRVIKKSLM